MARSRNGCGALGGRPTRRRAAALLLGGMMVLPSGSAAAQSLLNRPPNLGGTWVGVPGTVEFHFMHRFAVSAAPARKVSNSPTFLLSTGLPGHTMVGARYATSSALATGRPNEWEFFGRWAPAGERRGVPLDASLHVGYNHAADSFDGEVMVARTLGRVRVMAGGRGFSNFARSDEARWVIAGGATIRLTQFVALAGDVATLLDRTNDEDPAWSAGLQLQIPYTPHTLSLHISNAHTTTLQGASAGLLDSRFGFEFTVPFTVSRYLGGRPATVADVADAPTGDSVEVGMTNRLTFEPRTLRIRAGQTVVWRNTSDVIHTVTADPARVINRANVRLPDGAATFDSGDMPPGAVFRHTFTVRGEYHYVCLPHEIAGAMLGVVIVE